MIKRQPFLRIAPLAVALLAIGLGIIATRAESPQTDGSLATLTAQGVAANQLHQISEYAMSRSSRSRISPFIRQAADCKKRFYPCSSNQECCSGVCGSGGACVGQPGQ
jgi:hypothetical protein